MSEPKTGYGYGAYGGGPPAGPPLDVVVTTALLSPPVVVVEMLAGQPGPAGQWVYMTQAAYDALDPKDPDTLYVIVPDPSLWTATADGAVTP